MAHQLATVRLTLSDLQGCNALMQAFSKRNFSSSYAVFNKIKTDTMQSL